MTVTFQKFINLVESNGEETSETKLAVFAFGRFNPPTRGHEKLINAVLHEAHVRGGDAFIFTSHSQDSKKNPLEYGVKITFMRQLFPTANVVDDQNTSGISRPIKNAFDAAGYLSSLGYTDIVLVAGSDRVSEYQTRFNKAGQFFKSFEVVSAGIRDPEAEDAAGMSGTKAREAAKTGDIGKFRAATGWSGEIAMQLMKAVRQGMGVE